MNIREELKDGHGDGHGNGGGGSFPGHSDKITQADRMSEGGVRQAENFSMFGWSPSEAFLFCLSPTDLSARAINTLARARQA
jgi:hypothetical protein